MVNQGTENNIPQIQPAYLSARGALRTESGKFIELTADAGRIIAEAPLDAFNPWSFVSALLVTSAIPKKPHMPTIKLL